MILIGNTRFALGVNLFLMLLCGFVAAQEPKAWWGVALFAFLAVLCAMRRKQAIDAIQNVREDAYEKGFQEGRSQAASGSTLVCRDCGHENQGGWNFCSSCGVTRTNNAIGSN